MNPQKQLVLVLGGARSGKSTYAQKLAEAWWHHPLYLAPAETLDDEMAERVRQHRDQRGPRWGCAEEPLDIARVIRKPAPPHDGVLLDCATLWLTNVLLKEGPAAVKTRQKELLDSLSASPAGVIIVSNEVGMGIVPESALGREFRDLQGWLNQDLARTADIVILVVAGIPLAIKGALPAL